MPPSERTIAIVEDDASFRRAIERLLRASEFEAQDLYFRRGIPQQRCARVACLPNPRYHLPGMSGFELLDHLIASVVPPPAIFITAEDEDSVRQRASLIPNSVYLQKPFAGTVLLTAVRSLLNRGGSCEEELRKMNPKH